MVKLQNMGVKMGCPDISYKIMCQRFDKLIYSRKDIDLSADIKELENRIQSKEHTPRTSAEEMTGLRQVSVRLEADQRLRHRSGVEIVVLIMLAVLLANTVFYKAKKRLLTRNDADGRRFIICYIHHQDGQKH